jgi:uncharacterized protein
MTATVMGALIIGLTLGLLGSGGSILTVPVLVYLAGEPEKLAIAESLLIVGVIATVGAGLAARRRQVVWRAVAAVGVPGMAGAWLGAWGSRMVDARLQLAALAVLMLVSAGLMLRRQEDRSPAASPTAAAPWLAVQGLALGAVTGFVGVGGGFLIVPVLVLASGLSIGGAVGTSLAIIALNAYTSFLGHLPGLAPLGLRVSWSLVAIFVGCGVAGVWVGQAIGHRLPQHHLRRAFALFLLGLGGWMIWAQV